MPAPPVSALESIAKLDRTLVDSVRDRFLQDVAAAAAAANTEHYEQSDIDTVRTNSWQVERFLLESKLNADLAFKSLRKAMRWRAEQKVNHLKPDDFPAEYYRSGYIVQYGHDRAGASVVIFRANIHRKTAPEWNERLKQFFIYQVEQIERNTNGNGVALVIDCASIGMSNLDIDLLKFIVTSFSQYYPKLFDAILVNELPYLLTYVFKLVQSWLPEEDRKFFHLTNKKTITDFIDRTQLPSFLSNGTNPQKWQLVPPGVLPVAEFVHTDRAAQLGLVKPDLVDKLSYLNAYV